MDETYSVKDRIKSVLKIIRRILCMIVLVVLVLIVFCNLFVCLSSKGKMHTVEDGLTDDGYDCVIVLGAGVRYNQPSPLLAERLDAAFAVYEAGAAPKILVSGDHGDKYYNEVAVMRNYLMEKGVPSEDIFMDHAGFSTYETMYRAHEVFGVEKAVVVTQKYHLYRAIFDATSFDIYAEGVIATGHVFAEQTYWNLREAAARVKDFFFCLFKPEPTYLGDTIDIHGNGEVTLD